MTPKIETRDLTRVVDGEAIVDGLSVSVAEGEVLVVVGPSGAGKSSLLRLLNRLDEPTGGTVLVDGEDYRSIPPRELRRRVGFVPQDPALVPGTVFENVARGPRLRGDSVDEEAVGGLLDRLGLGGYGDRDVEELSGGEKQRVAIARTLLTEPDVLLLDEPTSHLDSASERRVESLLSDLIRDLDLTVVLVTHDEEQAKRIGNRALSMREGRADRIGPIEEVFA
ncbi:ATP-binding cassette domain-containing protein [Halalkalicoccus sp. NIPERK01]|uniref:ABC transporter ATP-binding protein n=1 Tax=Halalkalicoccus sp. NIPERK01 TaxID=3053469 RepID=UPI00256F4195|nr:ATP-binding cassette domain-containing protein [Halalkalicoccus sp. NIPERK01]MDL5361656.1 ATP-binding cassette domain-containing protein [Halalkalicoccus sp. NIPERK01]